MSPGTASVGMLAEDLAATSSEPGPLGASRDGGGALTAGEAPAVEDAAAGLALPAGEEAKEGVTPFGGAFVLTGAAPDLGVPSPEGPGGGDAGEAAKKGAVSAGEAMVAGGADGEGPISTGGALTLAGLTPTARILHPEVPPV